MIHNCPMKIAALPALFFALLVCAAPAFAQASAQSSPEDRQRFVAIVHNLERTPLDPALRDDRKWALQWLIEAPDVSVNICLDPLGRVSDKHYAHAAEIVVQYSIAMGAFIIENPGKANDSDAQQLAGVESALTAYRAMRTAQPDKISPEFEKLLAKQSRGELPGFVHDAFASCSAKG